MGSSQSVQAQSASEKPQMTAEEMQLKQIEQSIPRYSRPETFDEKLYRKVGDGRNNKSSLSLVPGLENTINCNE
jgi:hypothetical protein